MAIADRIWWTRKARIQTEKRLLSNAFQAQLILLWYSFFAVFVSVYYLKFNTTSEYSGVAWVIFSVMVLIISSFTSGLSFKERASLIKECYETLGGINQKALRSSDDEVLEKEYGQVLNVCENHTERDFNIALCLEYLSHSNPCSETGGLTKKPTKFIWMMFVYYKVARFLFLILMYCLPIVYLLFFF